LLVRLFTELFEFSADNASMQFEKVKSKSVSEIGYDPSSQTLGVVYTNGLIFAASDVPKFEFVRLRNSEFDRDFPTIVLAKFKLKRTGRRAPMYI